jgi:hypothetical protein
VLLVLALMMLKPSQRLAYRCTMPSQHRLWRNLRPWRKPHHRRPPRKFRPWRKPHHRRNHNQPLPPLASLTFSSRMLLFFLGPENLVTIR